MGILLNIGMSVGSIVGIGNGVNGGTTVSLGCSMLTGCRVDRLVGMACLIATAVGDNKGVLELSEAVLR